ncbi:MAG: 50S ribosomal protein L9 [Patescibacteria group bacterium]
MKIILLKDVARLGRVGDIKDVSDGYANNFLLPRKLAIIATPARLREFELNKEKMTNTNSERQNVLEGALGAISGPIEIKGKANEKGHLYKEIHEKDIMNALKKQYNIELPPNSFDSKLHLKELGQFTVELMPFSKKFPIVVNVVGE